MKAELELGDIIVFEVEYKVYSDLDGKVVVPHGSVAKVQRIVDDIAWSRICRPGDEGTPQNLEPLPASGLVTSILDDDSGIYVKNGNYGWDIFDADFVPPVGWVHVERDDATDFYVDDWAAANEHFGNVGSLLIRRPGDIESRRCITRLPLTEEAVSVCSQAKVLEQVVGITPTPPQCGNCNQELRMVRVNEWICDSCDGELNE
jgi:hypothetical protein